MAMLAERKRKQKWSLNPRGKEWSQDANKFGQKMLEKMGWQTGKGLGAHEDGITEHVKISYKNDSKGMGYKESNDQWTEHETHFSALLESLTGNDNGPIEKQVVSLEEKSQTSRARVHYHKFTRGKDLSRYSEKDLANIFGRRSLEKPKKEVKKESDSDSKENENRNDFLVNAGSMADYFKKKIPNFGKSNGYVIGNNGVLQKQDSESETESRPKFFGFGFNSQNNSKDSESESEARPSFGFGFKTTENTPQKSKIKNHSSESESDSKKLKNKMSFVSYVSENPNKRTAEEHEKMEVTPKKKSKKDKKKVEENLAGISNPAFNPMATPIKVQKHSLNTIEESLTEELEESIAESTTERKNIKKRRSSEHLQSSLENLSIHSPKKKKKHNNAFSNPSFHDNIEETTKDIVMHEIPTTKSKKKKKKKDVEKMEENTSSNSKQKSKSLEIVNPIFNESDVSVNSGKVEENPYEVKIKKKDKKSKKREIDNPSFDDIEDNSIDTSQVDENPYEIKPNKKKKKKKDKQLAIDNPSFDDQLEKSVESINPYEIKPKKKKKKKNIEESGIANPALDLNSSKGEESTILEDCDLMLNIVSTPVQKEERNLSSIGIVSRADSVKSRKSVRFSDVTQELIIPNNEDNRKIYGKKEKSKKKNKGLDNVNFDKEKNHLDENIDTMAKTLDRYQAEIENDINEEKIKTFTSEDFMVGEVGNPEGENEKLREGTKLKFKYANLDTKTPFYMTDKIGAKKSYKHLIKGDILLSFKNTNLHEIQGYAFKRTSRV